MPIRSITASLLACLALTAAAAVPADAATIKPGAACTKVKAKKKVSNTTYRCEKWGSRKIWVVFSAPKFPAYEIDYMKYVVTRLLEDDASVECRLRDGIGVSSSMTFMANQFDRLLSEVLVPTGVKKVNWLANAKVSRNFMYDAADAWDWGNEMEASASWEVTSTEGVPIVVKGVNKFLGTRFHQWTFPESSDCLDYDGPADIPPAK